MKQLPILFSIATFLVLLPLFSAAQASYPPKQTDGKWGIWNDSSQKGCWLIKPTYDLIEQFDDFYKIYQDKKVGLFADGFVIQMQPQFEDVRYERYSKLIVAKKNGKWGRINEQGEAFIDFKYDDIQALGKSLLKVSNGQKYGLVDYQGEEIIPIAYNDIKYNPNENPYREKVIRVSDGEKMGLLDFNGVWWLPCQFEEVIPSLFITEKITKPKLFPVSQQNKWGFANEKGDIVIACKYAEVSPFHSGVAIVNIGSKGYYGLINERGEVITQNEYSMIHGFDPISAVSQVNIGEKEIGLIGINGKEILAPNNYHIKPFYEDPKKKKAKKKSVKRSMRTAEDFIARDELSHGIYRYALYEQTNEYKVKEIGLVSADGDLNFSSPPNLPLHSFRFGVLDATKNISLANQKDIRLAEFERASHYFKNYFIVQKDKQYGIYDVLQNKLVIPCEYGLIQNGSNYVRIPEKCNGQFFIVAKNGKYGLINDSNKILIPLIYKRLDLIPKNNIVIAKKSIKDSTLVDENRSTQLAKDKYALLNFNGEPLTDFEYDWIGPPQYGISSVIKNGLSGVIAVTGEKIIPCKKDNPDLSFHPYSKATNFQYYSNSPCSITEYPKTLTLASNYGKRGSSYFINLKGEIIDSFSLKERVAQSISIETIYKNGEFILKHRRSFGRSKFGKDIDPKIIAQLIEGSGGFLSVNNEGFYFYHNGKSLMGDQAQKKGNPKDPIRWIRTGKYIGFVNNLGDYVTPIHFEKVGPLSDGLICVVKDNKVGYLDANGTQVIPFKFEDDFNKIPQFNFKNGKTIARQNGQYGIINKKGETLVPFQFDGIVHYDGQEVLGFSKGKWILKEVP